MSKRKVEQLPKTLYVVMEDDGGGTWFPVSHRSIAEIPEDRLGDLVGVYHLNDRGTLLVEKRLD